MFIRVLRDFLVTFLLYGWLRRREGIETGGIVGVGGNGVAVGAGGVGVFAGVGVTGGGAADTGTNSIASTPNCAPASPVELLTTIWPLELVPAPKVYVPSPTHCGPVLTVPKAL